MTEVEAQLMQFQDYYQQIAQPFQWKFTRQDLERLMQRLPRSLPWAEPTDESPVPEYVIELTR